MYQNHNDSSFTFKQSEQLGMNNSVYKGRNKANIPSIPLDQYIKQKSSTQMQQHSQPINPQHSQPINPQHSQPINPQQINQQTYQYMNQCQEYQMQSPRQSHYQSMTRRSSLTPSSFHRFNDAQLHSKSTPKQFNNFNNQSPVMQFNVSPVKQHGDVEQTNMLSNSNIEYFRSEQTIGHNYDKTIEMNHDIQQSIQNIKNIQQKSTTNTNDDIYPFKVDSVNIPSSINKYNPFQLDQFLVQNLQFKSQAQIDELMDLNQKQILSLLTQKLLLITKQIHTLYRHYQQEQQQQQCPEFIKYMGILLGLIQQYIKEKKGTQILDYSKAIMKVVQSIASIKQHQVQNIYQKIKDIKKILIFRLNVIDYQLLLDEQHSIHQTQNSQQQSCNQPQKSDQSYKVNQSSQMQEKSFHHQQYQQHSINQQYQHQTNQQQQHPFYQQNQQYQQQQQVSKKSNDCNYNEKDKLEFYNLFMQIKKQLNPPVKPVFVSKIYQQAIEQRIKQSEWAEFIITSLQQVI